jgi:hypothetical protein
MYFTSTSLSMPLRSVLRETLGAILSYDTPSCSLALSNLEFSDLNNSQQQQIAVADNTHGPIDICVQQNDKSAKGGFLHIKLDAGVCDVPELDITANINEAQDIF